MGHSAGPLSVFHRTPGRGSPPVSKLVGVNGAATVSHELSDVYSFSVTLMRDLLVEAGLDPHSAFVAAGIRPFHSAHAESEITAKQELAFQLGFAKICGQRRDLWIAAGAKYIFSMFPNSALALATAPTLQDLAEVLSWGELFISAGRCTPLGGRRLAGVKLDTDGIDPQLIEFTLYRDVSALLSLLNQLWESDFPADVLEWQYDTIHPDFRKTVAFPVRTGCGETRLVWSSSLNSAPLPQGNERLHRCYRLRAQTDADLMRSNDDLVGHISSLVRSRRHYQLDVHDAAGALNMSCRTLQRRLGDLGLCFRTLVSAIREHDARRLLESSEEKIGAIGEWLGYSDVASFSRAFRDRVGVSPSEYRKRCAGGSERATE